MPSHYGKMGQKDDPKKKEKKAGSKPKKTAPKRNMRKGSKK